MLNSLWPMDCSMLDFPVLHNLLELTQTHVHWVGDAIQPSHSVIPFSCPQSFPASGSFWMSWLFASGGQNIGASASVFPKNVQGWFPLRLTDFISLLSKGLSRVLQHNLKTSILWHSAFFMVQLSHLYSQHLSWGGVVQNSVHNEDHASWWKYSRRNT